MRHYVRTVVTYVITFPVNLHVETTSGLSIFLHGVIRDVILRNEFDFRKVHGIMNT